MKKRETRLVSLSKVMKQCGPRFILTFLYGDVLLMHVFLAAIRRNAYEWYFTCTSNSEVTIATTGKIQLTLIPL